MFAPGIGAEIVTIFHWQQDALISHAQTTEELQSLITSDGHRPGPKSTVGEWGRSQ